MADYGVVFEEFKPETATMTDQLRTQLQSVDSALAKDIKELFSDSKDKELTHGQIDHLLLSPQPQFASTDPIPATQQIYQMDQMQHDALNQMNQMQNQLQQTQLQNKQIQQTQMHQMQLDQAAQLQQLQNDQFMALRRASVSLAQPLSMDISNIFAANPVVQVGQSPLNSINGQQMQSSNIYATQPVAQVAPSPHNSITSQHIQSANIFANQPPLQEAPTPHNLINSQHMQSPPDNQHLESQHLMHLQVPQQPLMQFQEPIIKLQDMQQSQNPLMQLQDMQQSQQPLMQLQDMQQSQQLMQLQDMQQTNLQFQDLQQPHPAFEQAQLQNMQPQTQIPITFQQTQNILSIPFNANLQSLPINTIIKSPSVAETIAESPHNPFCQSAITDPAAVPQLIETTLTEISAVEEDALLNRIDARIDADTITSLKAQLAEALRENASLLASKSDVLLELSQANATIEVQQKMMHDTVGQYMERNDLQEAKEREWAAHMLAMREQVHAQTRKLEMTENILADTKAQLDRANSHMTNVPQLETLQMPFMQSNPGTASDLNVPTLQSNVSTPNSFQSYMPGSNLTIPNPQTPSDSASPGLQMHLPQTSISPQPYNVSNLQEQLITPSILNMDHIMTQQPFVPSHLTMNTASHNMNQMAAGQPMTFPPNSAQTFFPGQSSTDISQTFGMQLDPLLGGNTFMNMGSDPMLTHNSSLGVEGLMRTAPFKRGEGAISADSTPSHSPKKIRIDNTWNNKESAELLVLVKRYESDWNLIATVLKRSIDDCQHHYAESGLPRRGRWSPEEDTLLIEMHTQVLNEHAHFSNCSQLWSRVAELMAEKEICAIGRTGTQCMARYEETLDPALKRGKWSVMELELLEKTSNEYGKQWVKISERIPGRTQRQCRARWLMLKKKREKQGQNISTCDEDDAEDESLMDDECSDAEEEKDDELCKVLVL